MTVWEIWNNATVELATLKESVNSLYTTYCEIKQAYDHLMDSHSYIDAEEKEAFAKVYTALMEYRSVFNKIKLWKEIQETAKKLMDLTGECE